MPNCSTIKPRVELSTINQTPWGLHETPKFHRIRHSTTQGQRAPDHRPKAERADRLNHQPQTKLSAKAAEELQAKCTQSSSRDSSLRMEEINISVKGEETLLAADLTPVKAAGTDGIYPRVPKELAVEITPILTAIYQASLHSASFPDNWGLARVASVFKKGEHHDRVNCRPVSLTSIPCKVMEHILVLALM